MGFTLRGLLRFCRCSRRGTQRFCHCSAQRIRELPGFTLSPAGGGIYLFPGVGPTGLTSAEACERILEEAHVLVLPGSAFGDAGEGYLRIACTVGLDKMEEAFGRMAQMPMLQGR